MADKLVNTTNVGRQDYKMSSKFNQVERLRYRSACYADLADWLSVQRGKQEIYCRPISGDVLIEMVPENEDSVFVDIGLGVYVSMTSKEALKFSEKETRFFAGIADKFEQEAAQEIATELAMEKARQHKAENDSPNLTKKVEKVN